jgi:hypothetical protein
MMRAGGVLLASAVAALAALPMACGNDEVAPRAAFSALTGADVIAATRGEHSATVAITEHASVAAPGTDHGGSGDEEQDQTLAVTYDFDRNRSVTRWQFPSFGLVPSGVSLDEPLPEPKKVEGRAIGNQVYVRDGSWLCPGCGMDETKPLPSDKWIVVPVADADKAFAFLGSIFSGQLGWLELVERPVEPGETLQLKGTEVARYTVRLPADDVTAAIPSALDDVHDKFQGDVVAITFWADREHRLRKLVVEYQLDDRTNTVTARVESFGDPVSIEVPPKSEIYQE